MSEPLALFGAEDEGARRAVGATERQTRRALDAAQLGDQYAGAASVLCDLAWAIDAARTAGKFYGVAQAAPAYTDLARALGLTVDATSGKGGTGDELDDWLRKLTSPTMGDPAQP